MDIYFDRGTLKIFVDKRLGMIITRRKDSQTLQGVSTTMAKCVGKVTVRKGRESIIVKYPKVIITYQQIMGGVDRGYQHRLMGAGFEMHHFWKCLI